MSRGYHHIANNSHKPTATPNTPKGPSTPQPSPQQQNPSPCGPTGKARPFNSKNNVIMSQSKSTTTSMQNSKIIEEAMNTKYQAPRIAILTMIVLQLFFYVVPAVMLYWLLAGCYLPLALCITMSVMQKTLIRRCPAYIHIMNKYFRINEYLNIVRIHQEPESLEQTKTLYCYHPHSVYGFGVLLNANHPKYENEGLSRAVTFISNLALIIPIFGLHLKLLGISGADSANVKSVLKAGRTCSIVPGGFEQATLTIPDEFRIYIKKREGFLKYAMRYNYSIRQVLLLNEHKQFHTFRHLLWYRLLLNRIKLPGTIFFSKLGLILPPSTTIPTIVGRQLKYSKVYRQGEQPTNQQINQFHQIYIKELVTFYQLYRHVNGGSPIVVY